MNFKCLVLIISLSLLFTTLGCIYPTEPNKWHIEFSVSITNNAQNNYSVFIPIPIYEPASLWKANYGDPHGGAGHLSRLSELVQTNP